MVASAVAELELLDLGARRLAYHLVPEAYPEDGHLAEKLLDLRVRARNGLRVARSVRQEHAVGLHGEHLFCGRIPRHRHNRAARTQEVLEDGALRPAVVGHDLMATLAGGRHGERLAFRKVVEFVGLLARYGGRKV